MSSTVRDKPGLDLVDAAAEAGCYSIFLGALKASGLEPTLRGAGPYTLFAPRDDAFEKLPAATSAKLIAPDQKGLLISVLGYHFAAGQVLAARFAGKKIGAVSYEGGRLHIDGGDGGFTVNGAIVVQPDVLAANGVLHGIDQVLWPRAASAAAGTAPIAGIA